jgi:hypothetical protein
MRAALAFGIGLLLLAAPARAQHPCPGHLSATALGAVPANATFGAALGSDTPVQMALRDRLFEALRRAGQRVGDPPTHVLSWRGGLSQGFAGGAGTSRADLLFDDRNSFQDSDDLHWMQDVPRTRRAPRAPAALRLNATVELRDVRSGRVVWVAVLSCDRQGEDQGALIGTLVGAVVPAIGQTVSARPF